MSQKTAVIIGAGPAGLTAAIEMLRTTDVKPVIYEMDSLVGGISKTVNYNGNRMDLGGHRFFSKSDWVMAWWQSVLPIQGDKAASVRVSYQNQTVEVRPLVIEATEGAFMLVRPRLSRIFFLRKFFDYPIKMNWNTVSNLGVIRMLKIGSSYVRARLLPRSPEASLEDFIVNRFGQELYRTFFKDYTEKVWGVPCSSISAEWGAQRIKGLSVTTALKHALVGMLKKARNYSDVSQKKTETSLIEQFLYPRLGPGQMWEIVAKEVVRLGGEIHLGWQATELKMENGRISGVLFSGLSGDVQEVPADYVISTMPVKDLAEGLGGAVPDTVLSVAKALPYRDFITVGVLVRRLLDGEGRDALLKDNWIYIQESDVKLGRLQIFNNWSPDLVPDKNTIWLGLEYFCNEGDELWRKEDSEFRRFAIHELASIGLINVADVIDSTIVRVPKAYPAYFGAYEDFDRVRNYLDTIPNLYPVGRNGMHRYNNQDHSMLTAKLAVECIANPLKDKREIWLVNSEDEYHEEKS